MPWLRPAVLLVTKYLPALAAGLPATTSNTSYSIIYIYAGLAYNRAHEFPRPHRTCLFGISRRHWPRGAVCLVIGQQYVPSSLPHKDAAEAACRNRLLFAACR